MKNENSLWAFLLVTLLNVSGCAVQQQAVGPTANVDITRQGSAVQKPSFEPTANSRRQAIAKGQIREFFASMESMGPDAQSKSDWARASMAYTEASFVATHLGQLQKAVAYGIEAIEMGERAKNPALQVAAIIWLGQAYAEIGQPEKQREWLTKGIDRIKQISGNREFYEGMIYRQLGRNYLLQNETPQAIEHTTHSVQVFESLLSFLQRNRVSNPQARQRVAQIEPQIVNGYNQLGTVYLRADNPQEAIKAFERGMALFKSSTIKVPLDPLLTLGLGQAYAAQGDFARALEHHTKALEMAEEYGQTDQIQMVTSQLGALLLKTGRESDAIPYLKKALDSIESTRSQLESEEFRTAFFEGKGDAYSGMIQAQLAGKNFDDAFNYSERARSRSFLDILGNKVQLARSGTLLEHERELQARISLLRATLGSEGRDTQQAPQLRKELDEAQKDYNDYLAKLRKENKEQASLMNVEPLTVIQVQDRLDPGVTMLEYFVTGTTVWLWVVEKDRVQFVSTPIARKDLVAKVTELRDTIYQLGEKERFNTLSQELQKLLIQPALPHIRGKELIIVPHDVLHYLPFQALQSPDGRYLIEKYPIYYLSSASLMQFTQEKRRAMGERVLAFGNPDLEDPKMALQFAEIEAGEIKKLYPQSTVLLKKEATEGKAKSLSPQNDIVHFASHAELSEDDPLASAILLAKSDKEDGRLEVREIFGMDLKASLVVLSACETGLGKLSSGDELVGLTRAFIYAGTPSVVASLWNVEDSSTAQLMASFYKNLKTMTKVEALRQAQLNLIRGNVNSDLLARRGIGGVGKLGETPNSVLPAPSSVTTSHPYFWAPFILVGEGK
jgi:CHAT domain-containing protein